METIIRCAFLVLVTMVFGAHLGVNGLCVWPCSRQHRTYIFVGSLSTTAEFSLPGDLTFIETTDSVLTHVQCIERSRPFYSVRINNGRHDLYRCNKDALYHPEDDVIVIYANEYRYFETPPTICDVCDGKDYNIVLTARDEAVNNCRIPSDYEIPELGCNIPRICPVTMNGQIQCTRCEPSQGDDDGLCCKPKRVVYRYKSYDKPSRPNRDYRRNRPSRYNKRNRPSRDYRRNRPSRYNKRNRPNRDYRRNRPSRYNKRNRPNRDYRRNRPSRYNKRNRPNRDYRRNRPSRYNKRNRQSKYHE